MTPNMDTQNKSNSLLYAGTLLISLVAVVGSLWLSIGMNLKACPLCLYQRSFVIGTAAVLLMGLITRTYRRECSLLAALSLPLATAGLAIAAFHVYLEFSGKLECPLGMLGLGTAPQQSFTILFVLVLALLAQAINVVRGDRHSNFVLPVAMILGCLVAYACIVSAPSLPKVPDKAYESPLDTCRPPFPAK